MNEKKLAKKYIEKFVKHEPLYIWLKNEGHSDYESIKHCYKVEVEDIGDSLLKGMNTINKKKRLMYNEVIVPFSEAMLSLEELLEINYTDLKDEMKKEMENLL